jgi:TolB-like protein/DNA-binding winged helix-turn-helix (wHTH) protein/Tfp pilus assembly protein PilF
MVVETRMKKLPQQIYSFGDFTLDLARARLTRAGQEVRLRPKSFEALCYLIENPGRLISKEEMIQALWPDTFVTDDSLVKCLRDVRLALGDSSNHYIKTVARKGYLFDVEVIEQGLEATSAVYTEQVEAVRLVIEEGGRSAEEAGTQQAERNLSSSVDLFRSRFRPAGKVVAASVLVAGLLVFLLYLWASNRSRQADSVVGVRSIAVLPFKPLGQDEADRDLGLGMADTLITRLSGLGGIVVRPTSAVQRYASPDQVSLAAGREQLVDVVLEGSIQRSGDRLRVTVRLLNVRDGSPLWADKYDQQSTEVFAIQDAISEKVAGALALKLNGEERQRLAKRYTENIEAYQLYARGVFLRNQMTEEGLRRSIECLQKAIELDPKYGLAYAGLASSISPQAWFGYMTIREAEIRNRQLISKALELDDTLAEAHAALGEFKLFLEWDWEGAEREFKRALELNPNEHLTRILYPDLLLIKGRPEEAIAISESAVEIDPVSPRVGKAAADIYFLAGRYDRAIEQFKKVRELFPNYLLINPGPSYERKGMYDHAVQEYLDNEVRWGMPAGDVAALRQAYGVRGWRGYWQKRLELAREEERQRPVRAIFLAELYARLGEKDQALEWLERAYEERHPSLIFLNLDPKWESLRPDPRFHSLLQHIGLTP